MATQQIFNEIVSYGIQKKKKKEDIMAALLKSGQFDVVQSASALKALTDLGSFDYQTDENPYASQVDTGDATKDAQLTGAIQQLKQIGKKALQINTQTSAPEARVGGVLRSIGQKIGVGAQTPDIREYEALTGNVALIARAMGNVGVLTDKDIEQIQNALPKLGDTPEETKRKLNNIFDQINAVSGQKVISVDELSGRNNVQEGQQSQVQPGFQEAIQFAQQNPNDPRSQKLLEGIQSGKIDPQTGKKIESQSEISITQPEITQKEKGIFSRFFSAAVEQIPELAGELGGRLRNIWDNISEHSEKAKERSVFENVIRGLETQFRNLGEVGGAVGDVAGAALELAYDTALPEETRNKIKQKANEFIQTPEGQSALQALQGGFEKWDEFKKGNPNLAKDAEAAFNIITALPLAKGLGVAGKEAKAVTGDILEAGSKIAGRDATEKTSKQIFKAVKPSITVDRNKANIRQVLNTANKEVIGRGIVPKNMKEYAQALSETRKKVWSDIERALGKGKDVKVSLKDIADEIKAMASDSNLLRVDKAAANKINKIADSLLSEGKELSVPDAEILKQFINAELKGAFGKFNLSNAEQNAKKLITKRIGEKLDKVLSDVPGEFKSLKNKYGALRQTEDDVLKRLVVFERQNPEGLVDSFSKVSGIGNIVKGITTLNVGEIAKGAGEIAIGKIQKAANNADNIIKKSFEKLSKQRRKFEPKSKTLKALKEGKLGLTIQQLDEAIKTTEQNIRTLKSRGLTENSNQVKKLLKELNRLREAERLSN